MPSVGRTLRCAPRAVRCGQNACAPLSRDLTPAVKNVQVKRWLVRDGRGELRAGVSAAKAEVAMMS